MIEVARRRRAEIDAGAQKREQYGKLRDGTLKPVIAAWRQPRHPALEPEPEQGNETGAQAGQMMQSAAPVVSSVSKAGPWGALIAKGASDFTTDMQEGGVQQHVQRGLAAGVLGPLYNFTDVWKT